MYKLIIQGHGLSEHNVQIIAGKLGALEHKSHQYHALILDYFPEQKIIDALRFEYQCDLNIIPEGFDASKVKLVISDMDSTLITIECIDEIADFAGLKPQVAAITEAAMRGELDFAQSLTQRVSLLKGLPVDTLQKVYTERLNLSPGAETLIQYLKKKDIHFALVSGGFTYFTDQLRDRLGLNYTLANQLAFDGDTLTGEVEGEIVDSTRKANFLTEICNTMNISPSQAVAIGDGANDLAMMAVAGMGVAYHAKPTVQQQADCALNYSGLDGLLALLEIETN